MVKRLSEFAFVLLDATFFTALFPDELAEQFADVNLYVPKTFYSEQAQYRKLLPVEKKALYDRNFAAVSQGTVRPVEIDEVKYRPFRSDTWGTVNVLSKMANEKQVDCLLITSNQLLIQRVILGGISVGIYDLSGNVYIPVEEQTAWKAACEFQRAPGEDLIRTWDYLPEELTLYRPGGVPVHLLETGMDGAEAKLYALPEDEQLVAKVFSGESLGQNKIRNVRNLQKIGENIATPWVMFPKEELFWDKDCTDHAGFLQTYAKNVMGLDQNPMYLGNLSDSQCRWETRISETVDRCIQLVRQIALLNVYGMYLSDFNLANFAIHPQIPQHIFMWDADSFCSRYYPPASWDNSTQPACLIHQEETSNAKAIVDCTELLYICVFRILTLGQRAFAPDRRRFLMERTNDDTRWKQKIVPDNVWHLFEVVFKDNNRSAISVDALLHELTLAAEEIRTHPEQNLTYRQAWEKWKQNPKPQAPSHSAGKPAGSEVTPVPNDLPGRLGKKDWSGLDRDTMLRRVRLLSSVQTPSVDATLRKVEVTPMHYRRCQIRPPVYQTKKKSRPKRLHFWMILVLLCLLGWGVLLTGLRYTEHMEELLPMVRESLAWLRLKITLWYQALLSH